MFTADLFIIDPNWMWQVQMFFIFKDKKSMIYNGIILSKASQVAQWVKNLPAKQETWVWSLGWEDPLEEGMADHSSILAWEIPGTEEPSMLQSKGSQRVGHDWNNWPHMHVILSIKRSRFLIHKITWTHLKIISWVKEIRNRKVQALLLHVWKVQKRQS